MLGKAYASIGIYFCYNVLLFIAAIPYAMAEVAVTSIVIKILLYLASAFLFIVISGVLLSTALYSLYNDNCCDENDCIAFDAILSVFFIINIIVCIFISNKLLENYAFTYIIVTIISSLSILSCIYPSLTKYNPIFTLFRISQFNGLLVGEDEHQLESLLIKRLKSTRIIALTISFVVAVLTFLITYFSKKNTCVNSIDYCLCYASFISLLISTTVYFIVTHRARNAYADFLGV